jgi:hypothetical protein
MKKGVDYKEKYMQLRARYLQAIDVAFRSGYQQGMEKAQIQAAAQQLQQSQQQAAQAQAQPQQVDEQPSQGVSESQASELDAYIDALEAELQKSESENGLGALRGLRELVSGLKKSKIDISALRLNETAAKNMSAEDKSASSRQQKLVESFLDKWEKEARKTAGSVAEVVGTSLASKD